MPRSFVLPLSAVILACVICLPANGALPSPPPDRLQPEKAWIKENGMPVETWGQYNDTGANRLNLTYRHSTVNFAYVIRSPDPQDQITTTFILYRNQSGANGFDSTGHLFPGSTPVWTVPLGVSGKQTEGQYTYHLFMITYDPEGATGLYQLRINVTGTVTGGSSWTQPGGNPNVPWLFFEVPVGTSYPVSISDQLGRYSPFFFGTPIPSTAFNATFAISPPGNQTGSSTAHAVWNHTNGTVMAEFDVPVYYAGQGRWAAQSIMLADNSTFPENYTTPYKVKMTLDSFEQVGQFYVYPPYAAILPETWLTKHPPIQTENTSVEFEWIGSDLDGQVVSYQYRMGTGNWISTTQRSTVFAGLANGTYVFQVRSVDDDGLVDLTPASKEFRVYVNQPPDTQIVAAPNSTTRVRDILFAWQGTDADGTVISYEYRLDGADWTGTPLTSITYLNMTSGYHTFQVRSIDDRDLADPTPATYNFTILPSWCELELERLEALVELLEGRIDQLEGEVANLTELLEEAEGENDALRSQIQSLNNEKAYLQSLVTSLGNEKTQLLNQIANLTAENQGLRDELEDCGDLTRELRETISQLNQTIADLMQENEGLAGLVEELRERVSELEAQIPEFGHGGFILLAAAGMVSIIFRRYRKLRL